MILAMIGTTELLLIGCLALLLFGGKKLPEMMRGLGQGVREFKKGVNELNSDLESEAESKDKKELDPSASELPEQSEGE